VNEFDLIERIAGRLGKASSVLVGIGDDAAVLRPSTGRLLVATTDSLIPEHHFQSHWPVAAVGHLALAVNLSDIAAMAATPRWALLALTLPEANVAWLDGFLDGFLALAKRHKTELVGGNLARGPLNINVQLLGEADPIALARRCGSRPGDHVLVSGTLGDAAGALSLGDRAADDLRDRLQRPEPRVALASAVGRSVQAMIDVSDGLSSDLARLLSADRLGARLELDRLPVSAALDRAVPDLENRWRLQLTGGSDYELLMTVAPEVVDEVQERAARLGCPVSSVGRVVNRPGIVCCRPDGSELEVAGGWDHFA